MTTLADINSQIKKHDEQIAQLRQQAEALRNQERAGVIEEIRKKIAEYGISASDLKLAAALPAAAPSSPRRARVPPNTAARPAKPGPAGVAASRAG